MVVDAFAFPRALLIAKGDWDRVRSLSSDGLLVVEVAYSRDGGGQRRGAPLAATGATNKAPVDTESL